jgi:hypothetical protein
MLTINMPPFSRRRHGVILNYTIERERERERSIDHGISWSVKFFFLPPTPFGYHFFTPFLDRWSVADHVKRSNRRLLPSGRTVVSGWGGEYIGANAGGGSGVVRRSLGRQSGSICAALKPNWKVAELLLSPSEERAQRAHTYTAAAAAHEPRAYWRRPKLRRWWWELVGWETLAFISPIHFG